MRGGKMTGMISVMLLMSSAAAAAVPDRSDGLASNRTALALAGPDDQAGSACKVGDPVCVQTASAGAQSGSHLLLLLGGVALAAGIAAAAASGHHHHHPVSP